MQNVRGIKRPRIGLLNGTEKAKEAPLRKRPINY